MSKQPPTEVSFAATPPFVRAFGEEEASKQQAKFNGKPALNPLLRSGDRDWDDDMFVGIAFVAGVVMGVALGVLIGMKLA
jgi:hypothetical protein